MTTSSTLPQRDADGAGNAGPDVPPLALAGLWLIAPLLCLQSALFWAFAADRVSLPAYLDWHLGLCGAAAVIGSGWALGSSSPSRIDRIAMVVQIAVWTALAGPFGTIVAAGFLVPRTTKARADASALPGPSVGPGAPLSRLELLHGALLDQRLHLDQAHAVRPLLDIFLDGEQREKFDALSLISKRYDAAAAPALKRALEDKDGSVRVLAATVMAQQHNAYTKRIGECQAAARIAPDTSGGWSELSQAHLDYARSGLLEVSRVESELGHARLYLARAEQLDPSDALTNTRLRQFGQRITCLTPVAGAERVSTGDHRREPTHDS